MNTFYHLRPSVLVRKLVSRLPENMRYSVYRNQVTLDYETPEKIKFKLAATKDELEAAFIILHDEYVRSGFMLPHASGMRVTPYHALPSTSTLIGVVGPKVIATVSIIRESEFGFPMDKIFSTDHLRKNGNRFAEISSLAVAKDYRQNSGGVFFGLLKFMYEYCINYFGVDHLIIAVNPKHIDLYKSLLFFEELEQKPVSNYDFVNGAPARGASLNLREAFGKFAKNYANKKEKKNFFHFFCEHKISTFSFPDRLQYKISDPIMTPDLINYFFNEKTNLFKTLTNRELALLHYLYHSEAYTRYIPQPDDRCAVAISREYPRFDFNCIGQISFFGTDRKLKLKILDISIGGFLAVVNEGVRFGEIYSVDIRLSDFEVAHLKCFPVWKDERGCYGFGIDESCELWKKTMRILELEVTKVPHNLEKTKRIAA